MKKVLNSPVKKLQNVAGLCLPLQSKNGSIMNPLYSHSSSSLKRENNNSNSKNLFSEQNNFIQFPPDSNVISSSHEIQKEQDEDLMVDIPENKSAVITTPTTTTITTAITQVTITDVSPLRMIEQNSKLTNHSPHGKQKGTRHNVRDNRNSYTYYVHQSNHNRFHRNSNIMHITLQI